MDYIAIVKSSNYLADRITLTDIGKKLITKSCPSDAPLTIPAISTKDRAAGIIFSEENILASTARRSSGRPTTPTFGSMVAKG